MPQISLYIDGDTLRKVEDAAARQKISISKWVAEHIRACIEPAYPPDFPDLFGSIPDDTFSRPQEPSFRHDAKRAKL